MNHRIKGLVTKIIGLDPSPYKIAASCALGIFMACSPFLGIQTFFAVGLGWVLRLNVPIVLIVLYVVNNPLTMVPIIILNYLTGYVIFKKILDYSLEVNLPQFLIKTDTYLRTKLAGWLPCGIEFSFSYYLVGGIVFATFCALVSYPFLYRAFKHWKSEEHA
jgi:uncharacterized protein (DUF2062 family)